MSLCEGLSTVLSTEEVSVHYCYYLILIPNPMCFQLIYLIYKNAVSVLCPPVLIAAHMLPKEKTLRTQLGGTSPLFSLTG